MKVHDVLRQYIGGVHMGEGSSAETIPGGMSADLADISTKNRVYFQICFALVVLLLMASTIFVIVFINDTAKLGTVFGVTGVSVVGLIAQMISLWKQKVTADIVVILLRNLPSTETKLVLDVLLAKL